MSMLIPCVSWMIAMVPAGPVGRDHDPSAASVQFPVMENNGYLARFADIHRDKIVFTYEGDLWLVWTSGGTAKRITRGQGEEKYAKFSPDGNRIAFTASYDGGNDVYVMEAEGGIPRRLTFHPADDAVLDWFPDNKHVLFRSHREYPYRVDKIYKVSVEGGLPEKLPVDQAGLTALSDDGSRIAYNRISREFRTWKRYQGGMAQDIWMGSLEKRDYHKITDWEGTDNYPMWWGDHVYFTSDRRHGTLNLHQYDVNTGKTTALTHYQDYDVKYPSIGFDQIVYQYGERLHVLNLRDGKTRALSIDVPTDGTMSRQAYVDVTDHAESFGLSPSGKRLLLETRGEIVDVPVEEGRPVNLTRSSDSREKSGAWSPDGRWVIFLSDRAGEEEFYLVDMTEPDPRWKRITEDGDGFRMRPVWSPNGKYVSFGDKHMRLNLLDVKSGARTVIDRGEYDDGWERWGIQDYVWSPDSRWIAYTKMEESGYESIFLYSLKDETSCRVTDEMTEDFSPSFSLDGKYLYFLSHRHFSPIMGFVDQTHVFLDVTRPYLVVLDEDEPTPFAPEDVRETTDDGEKKDDAKKNEEEKEKKDDEKESDDGDREDEDREEDEKAVRVDVKGVERRIVPVEGVGPGNYFRLEAVEGGFLYLSRTERQFLKYQTVTDGTTDKLDLYRYDLKDEKPKKLMEGIENYHLSADGKKLVYRAGGTFGVLKTGDAGSVGDGKVNLTDVKIKIDPRAEFPQIFEEAWRVQRDWFYDPGMHGEDWRKIYEKYERFVPYCGDRSDLNYLIGEMIGELNAGHTYVAGGEMPDRGSRVGTGLLGVDLETPPSEEYHKIARVIPGNPWNPEEYSPLAQPGCPVKEGDYIIALDGEEIKSSDNLFAFLENKAGRVVRLRYNDKPSAKGAEDYLVKTLGDESAIRYREWVENNRRKVEDLSKGEIGYVHVPDMMQRGLIEFARAFYPQHYKKAMIIDDRYNTGGFVGDMIIDRLERALWALTQPREGKTVRNPERAFHGHLVVLINENTGSNGEYFAEAMKRAGLATLIGMRTWGGAVGIEPHQNLVDGGVTTPPQFAPFGLDGEWLIEGRGVEPDIEVQNLPGDVLRGRDAQLEKAAEFLLQKLQDDPKDLPERPMYPIKIKPKE